jgi:hypothetical protein
MYLSPHTSRDVVSTKFILYEALITTIKKNRL